MQLRFRTRLFVPTLFACGSADRRAAGCAGPVLHRAQQGKRLCVPMPACAQHVHMNSTPSCDRLLGTDSARRTRAAWFVSSKLPVSTQRALLEVLPGVQTEEDLATAGAGDAVPAKPPTGVLRLHAHGGRLPQGTLPSPANLFPRCCEPCSRFAHNMVRAFPTSTGTGSRNDTVLSVIASVLAWCRPFRCFISSRPRQHSGLGFGSYIR